jgi:AraC family transcriptional regulator
LNYSLKLLRSMDTAPALLQVPLTEEKNLGSLVENRKIFSMDKCELNVFETHRQAMEVPLMFKDMVLTSMLKGKKVMHLNDLPAFDYLPGESVILPPEEKMVIDFPEAHTGNPTQCIALAISKEQIDQTIEMLNYKFPKHEQEHWNLNYHQLHLINTSELTETINRVIKIGIHEKCKEKDLLLNFCLKELLIRLMQTEAKVFIEKHYNLLSTRNNFAAVIQYIKTNIREKISLKKLCEIACMSRASFFRHFKQELGVTPIEYILEERINIAKKLLKDPQISVTDICYRSGFNNLNYFTKVFHNKTGLSPSAYRGNY